MLIKYRRFTDINVGNYLNDLKSIGQLRKKTDQIIRFLEELRNELDDRAVANDVRGRIIIDIFEPTTYTTLLAKELNIRAKKYQEKQ